VNRGCFIKGRKLWIQGSITIHTLGLAGILADAFESAAGLRNTAFDPARLSMKLLSANDASEP
jgi:hypothetical protein